MHDLFEYSAWCNVCQQQSGVLRFSLASWQDALNASVEPWVVALEGPQRWQYLLSSAPVPSYSMLAILSNNSPSQRTAQHAHKITEAARHVTELCKGPYKEAWGTCKEPWGFAGSLGCLQRRSYAPTKLMYFVHVPISQPSVTSSPQKPFLVKRSLAREVTCFLFCCLSPWIVKMTTTRWQRFNSLIFPAYGPRAHWQHLCLQKVQS